jgi:hypothetical protein
MMIVKDGIFRGATLIERQISLFADEKEPDTPT